MRSGLPLMANIRATVGLRRDGPERDIARPLVFGEDAADYGGYYPDLRRAI